MPYAVSHLQETRTRRRKLGEELRSLIHKVQKEGRDYTPEEREEKEKRFNDLAALRAQVEDEEELNKVLSVRGSRADDVDDEDDEEKQLKAEGDEEDEEEEGNRSRRRSAPSSPDEELPNETREAIRAARQLAKDPKGRNSPEYAKCFRSFLTAPDRRTAEHFAEKALGLLKRDLQVDNELQAGILVPPVQFVKEILKDYDAETPTRQLARVIQVRRAKGLGIFKRVAKASTWAMGAEVGEPTKDTALKFGMRELHPAPASAELVVSRDFLREAEMNPESIVREEMVRDGAEFEEQLFLTGSGANEALGLYTAHADGISTARDVSTGNTTTAITLAGLRKAKAALRPGWWISSTMMVGRTGWEQIYGLDDGVGRPLFVESVRVGEPDRVLGFRLLLNEWNPDTFTTGKYVAIIGDFARGYIIADSLDMELERFDDSAYARKNQVGFIARKKFDGMPILEEAFVRVKLA